VVGRCSLGVVGRCSLGVADASGSSGEGDSAPFGLAGATWATHPGGDFILCCEAEKIDPTNAAVMILDGRLDCLRMAARLQSRIDIDW
jgi:hypothetical protein